MSNIKSEWTNKDNFSINTTTSDYINREMAISSIVIKSDSVTREQARQALKDIPSADVVEVVRCKDCDYYRDSFGETYCDMTRGHVEATDYCSYGKREE